MQKQSKNFWKFMINGKTMRSYWILKLISRNGLTTLSHQSSVFFPVFFDINFLVNYFNNSKSGARARPRRLVSKLRECDAVSISVGERRYPLLFRQGSGRGLGVGP